MAARTVPYDQFNKRVQAIQVANKLSILCFASSTASSFRGARVRRVEAENRGKSARVA
jgi:hypothetical protein